MNTFSYILFMVLVATCVLVNANEHDDHHHAGYKFEYGVKDSHTGDIKKQWEESDGHNVKGAYELKEADGTKRIVEYMADKHSGFHAIVKRIGHADHPAPKHHDHHGNDHHGHNDHGHGDHGHDHHGHGHASSYANSNLHKFNF